jgi:hypothetical protein
LRSSQYNDSMLNTQHVELGRVKGRRREEEEVKMK